MDKYNKIRDFLTQLALSFSGKLPLDANETNRTILANILMLLTLVFTSEQVLDMVKEISSGKYSFNQLPLLAPALVGGVMKMMQANSQPKIEGSVPSLTSREKDVLNLMAAGLMNKDIAKELYISEATVKNHVSSILRKLNATVRTEAVITGIKYGLIDINNNLQNLQFNNS